MRPKITTSNVNYYIRQCYGFKTTRQFFEFTEKQPKLKHKILLDVIRQFTGYKLDPSVKDGSLVCYNPYTDKYEGLSIKGFKHITSTDELLKELSMLHKTRMQMLSQSRKRILELSKAKKKTRDKDLQIKPKSVDQRLNQLSKLSHDKKRDLDIERS